MSILEVKGLKKTYTTRFGGNRVEVLKNVNFSLEKGEYVAIMGESGSGKTTLLNMLAALDKPTGGSVCLDGQELSKIKESGVAAFRRDNLGFVFQEFNLLDFKGCGLAPRARRALHGRFRAHKNKQDHDHDGKICRGRGGIRIYGA